MSLDRSFEHVAQETLRSASEWSEILSRASAVAGIKTGKHIGYTPGTIAGMTFLQRMAKQEGRKWMKDIHYGLDLQIRAMEKAVEWFRRHEPIEDREKWKAEALKMLTARS